MGKTARIAGRASANATPPDRERALFDQKTRAELALCDAIEDAADRLPAVCIGRYARISAALRALGRARDLAPLLSHLAEQAERAAARQAGGAPSWEAAAANAPGRAAGSEPSEAAGDPASNDGGVAATRAAAADETPAAFASAVRLLVVEEGCDADMAFELADAVDSAARAGGPDNPEALGYLMRGFFENRRRHLAWRREALIEHGRRLLSKDAFEALMRSLTTTPPDLRVVALAADNSKR